MLRRTYGIVAATVLLLAPAARATHNEPLKGNLFKANVVTAYQSCTSPTASTDPPGPVQAACAAVRRDTICGFGPKGTGKLQAKVLTDANKVPYDIAVQAILVGLDAGCEGETLTLSVPASVTSDDCIGAPAGCTYNANYTVGSCVVASGHCLIESTFNTAPPATLQVESGKRQAIEFGAWSFKRTTFTPFLAGILNP